VIFACVHLTLVCFVAARGMMSLFLVTNKQVTELAEDEDYEDNDDEMDGDGMMDSDDEDEDDEDSYDEGDEF
jgi:hypothetical protein